MCKTYKISQNNMKSNFVKIVNKATSFSTIQAAVVPGNRIVSY